MKFFLYFLLIFPCTHAAAQTIRGKVLDKEKNTPLEQVTVHVREVNSSTKTTANGQFECKRLSPGRYTLLFSHVGYQPVEQVIILRDTAVFLNIALTPASTELSGVTITGISEEQAEAAKVRNGVMPVTILTAKQIENRASNLNELLARQTGVQIRQTGGLGSEARISVRGLEGKRVQIFLDGNPLNTPDGSLGINDLPLQIIERIEIYKGTIPAWLGGDGLGSAVNIVIRHRDVSYIDATASYQSFNTLNTGLILKKTFEKPGIEVGAGIFTNSSDNNYVMESPFQPGLTIKRDHDHFRSVLTGASIRFHKLWFDEIELEGAYVDIQKQYQGVQRNIQHIESLGKTGVAVLSLKKKNLLNNRLSFKYNAALANINVKFVDTSSYSYDWEGKHSPSIYGKGELGIGPNLATTVQKEFRHLANVNYELSDIFTLNLNNTIRHGKFDPDDPVGNAFAGKNLFNYPGTLFNSITGLTFESRLNDKRLLFSTAIKHYYNKVSGYNTNIYLQAPPEKVNNTTNTFGYNAGMRYNFNEAWMVKASYERAIRLPLNAELFGDGALITPAILLKPEKAHNFTAGAIYDKTNVSEKRLQLEANAFYMRVGDMIQLTGTGGLTTGYVNYANVDIVGADAEAKLDLTRSIYVSGNITWQRLRDINKYLPGTQQVENPTYLLQIPNVPELFGNWNIEYHKDNLIASGTKARLIYEGSYTKQYSYSFNVSRYDQFFLPTYVAHNLVLEYSFNKEIYTITGEVHNITNELIINNWNMPLPGRTFRVKVRYLLLGKPGSHQ
jgi:outer membrane cobalamin receptor